GPRNPTATARTAAPAWRSALASLAHLGLDPRTLARLRCRHAHRCAEPDPHRRRARLRVAGRGALERPRGGVLTRADRDRADEREPPALAQLRGPAASRARDGGAEARFLGSYEQGHGRGARDLRPRGARLQRARAAHRRADRSPPLGLVHGDFRLDNLLFGGATSPRPLTVVDWQTVGYGPAMADAAYFLGGGLRAQDRRSREAELLERYHGALCERGVRADREACQEQLRRQTLGGVLMAIVASVLVE